MANWTRIQQERLAFEARLIQQEMPHFSFYNPAAAGATTICGEFIGSANTYRLCVLLGVGFPDEIPRLYVTSPCPLPGYGGQTIQSWGTSTKMHVWTPDWNNYVKICHGRPENWTASDTIVGVIMKGFLWIEAFEAHCQTGETIDKWSLED